MNTVSFSSWLDFDAERNKFNLDCEYRIILKDTNEYDEEYYTAVYMNSFTKYELYFNDATDAHLYGCININNLKQYEHRSKGRRDLKINDNKYPVYAIQTSTSNKDKWQSFTGKYFNINHEYRLIIDEEDSKAHNTSNTMRVIAGYLRQSSNLENKGFSVLVCIINSYYNDSGKYGTINMEQVVKRELYFTPSTHNHWYGCIDCKDSKEWQYRFQGKCAKTVNNLSYNCYAIKYREENQYKSMDEKEKEFNINYQYRIRLVDGGGYIVVERVSKYALYFGVSISKFWSGCVRINDLHSWHYVDKVSDKLQRVGKGKYSVYCVESKKDK